MKETFFLLKNPFYLLSARIIHMGLSLFYTILLARYLGLEDFGKLTIVLTFLMFFTLIYDFGFNRFIILQVSRGLERTESFAFNMIFLRIGLSLLSIGSMLGLTYLMGYSKEILHLLFIAGFILIPSSIVLTLDALIQSKERMDLSSLGLAAQAVLIALSGLIPIYLGLDLRGITLSLLIAHGLSLFGYLFIFFKMGGSLRPQRGPAFSIKSLRAAVPFSVISILGFIYLKADTILLSLLKGEEAVGLFGAAWRTIEGLLVFPMILMTAYFPRFSIYSLSDTGPLIRLYRLSIAVLVTLALPVAILCSAFSKPILEIVFGVSYGAADRTFSILAWSMFLMYLNAPAATLIQTSRQYDRFIPFAAANTLLNLVLNVILIPRYSLIGPSLSKIVTEITGFVILLHFISKRLDIRIQFLSLVTSFTPQAAASMGMAFGIFLMNRLHLDPWKTMILSSAAYATILLVAYGIKGDLPFLKADAFVEEKDRRPLQ